ncbi:hypothetical protein SB659_18620 [Arthrobacter sp. SIMBA_036]|uniref:hypothetical protein n=1 Tax=Arthrobacter sp. SIMBA_036 TaxID=3085778 RepID=UPI00397A30BD
MSSAADLPRTVTGTGCVHQCVRDRSNDQRAGVLEPEWWSGWGPRRDVLGVHPTQSGGAIAPDAILRLVPYRML